MIEKFILLLKADQLDEALQLIEKEGSYSHIPAVNEYRTNKSLFIAGVIDIEQVNESKRKVLEEILVPTEKARNLYQRANAVMNAIPEMSFLSPVLIWLFRKRYKLAERLYTDGISLFPYYADAYTNRGLVRHKLKNYHAAILDFRDALKCRPIKPDNVYYCLSVCYLRIKNKDNAQDCMKEIKNIKGFSQANKLLIEINKLK